MRTPTRARAGLMSDRFPAKPMAWTFGAIAISLTVCATIAWTDFRETAVLRRTISLTDNLGHARIDLAKGFLHVALASEPSSPFDRNQGIALLRQAVFSLGQCIAQEKQSPGSLHIQDGDGSLAHFRSSLESFRKLLDLWTASANRDPAAETRLRTAFHELDRHAAIFDEHILRNLNEQSAVFQRSFRYALGIAILLLSVVCLSLFLLSRAQQKATSALLFSEQRLRTLVQTIPDLVWLKDPEGVYVNCNPTFERFVGFTESEIVGRTDYDLFDKELADFFREHDHKAVAVDKPRVNEEWLTFADGAYRGLFETIKTPMRDSKGNLVGVLGIARDISERKRQADSLRKAEERYRSLFENMLEGCVYCKMLFENNEPIDFVYLEANSAFEKLTGLKNVVGKKASEVLPGLVEDRDSEFWRIHGRVASTGIPEKTEIYVDALGMWYSASVYSPEPGNFVSVFDNITDRKRADEELRASEERLRLFIEHAPAALAMFDRDMRYLAVSRRWKTDYRLGDRETIGMSHYEVFPEIPDGWKEAYRRGLAGEVVRADEDRFERLEGPAQWLRWEVRPWYTANSSIGGIVVFTEDITETKRAEQALGDSEERFRQVAESAGDWIWEVDENGLYRYCSPAVERILGYAREELEGKRHFFDLFAAEEKENLKKRVFQAFSDMRRIRDFVTTNVRKDGSIAVLETSGAPVLDHEGRLLGYRGVDRDITEKRRMQEAHRLLAEALKQTADSVAITDTNGMVVYANRAFEQVTGFTQQELLAMPYDVVDRRHNDPSLDRKLHEALAAGKSWAGQLVSERKGGSLYDESVTVAPVQDDTGKTVNFVVAKRDMSEAVSLQRRLAQAQKMEAIGTLAGGIAHDFNNIIFAITGFTELALEDLPQNSEIRSDLERVLMAATRAAEMVNQILAFSRQTQTEKKPLELSPVVKEGIKFLRAAIPSTIDIRQSIETDLGMVYGDPTQIHQVLMNLCMNAAHAMKETKGLLFVELKQVDIDELFATLNPPLVPGRCILMRVADTGHGIPPEHLNRIFEPYFTTKRAGEGTGLGLSTVHGIVRSHGGAITVYSEPGNGTSFNVFLPLLTEEAVLETGSDEGPIPTGHERILFIDDEPLLVELGQTTLERLGYTVVAQTDPIQALGLFRDDPQRFDLVITDLTMPKMTGTELARELTSIRHGIPLILCTGFSQRLGDEDAKKTGFRAVVGKPILKKDIARVIRDVLDEEGS